MKQDVGVRACGHTHAHVISHVAMAHMSQRKEKNRLVVNKNQQAETGDGSHFRSPLGPELRFLFAQCDDFLETKR